MERAEPATEPVENQAERAIAEAENEPTEKARRQQEPWQAQKPKNGNRSDKAENRSGGDIALHREAFQERGVIGNHQPRGENQSQADPHVHTGANRRVAEDVEPAITGQMPTNQHEALPSQYPNIRLTRLYHDGCVTSTTTGALHALSFPARSTAVPVLQ